MRPRSLSLLIVVCGMAAFLAFAEPERIAIDAPQTMAAGDAWAATITVRDAQAGGTVTAFLINGLKTHRAALTLGSGGVAVWRIPAGEIIQAGESLLLLRHDAHETRRSLTVTPTEPAAVDLFATANSIPAYGGGSAWVLLLPRDAYGNTPGDDTHFSVMAQYPGGRRALHTLVYEGGLGRYRLVSRNGPGRLRLTLDSTSLAAPLELQQTPGAAQVIRLAIDPACVPDDGREIVVLGAAVMDARRHPVADGTLVTFTWAGGRGYGQTIDGRATLRLPAPTLAGTVIYRAAAGPARSNPALLDVVPGACTEDMR